MMTKEREAPKPVISDAGADANVPGCSGIIPKGTGKITMHEGKEREALKLALEALETNNKAWKALADSGDAGWWEAEEQPFYEVSVKAITAIREALAERFCDNNCTWRDHHPDCNKAEQPAKKEPVRKVYICTSCEGVYADAPFTKCDCMPEKDEFIEGFIYTSPPASKPLPKGEWPKHPSAYVNDEYIGYSTSDLDNYATQVLAAHGITGEQP